MSKPVYGPPIEALDPRPEAQATSASRTLSDHPTVKQSIFGDCTILDGLKNCRQENRINTTLYEDDVTNIRLKGAVVKVTRTF